MGCLGLWEKSWRVRSEDMVRELVTGEVDRIYASTIRGRPDRWNAELWGSVYGLKQGWEGMATKRENCTRDIFSLRLDPKYGYFVKDCKDEREMRMLAFLVPIFSPDKPYNILTSFLPSPPTCFLHTSRRRWWIGKHHWRVGAQVGNQHQTWLTLLQVYFINCHHLFMRFFISKNHTRINN